jgi:hypothetical protein
MYVRWKRRLLRPARCRRHPELAEYVLYAVLVGSVRRDGAPRQCFLAHLGAIKERHLAAPTHQAYLWRGAREALDRLGIDGADRARLEATIAARVPCPSEEAVLAFRAECEGRLAALDARQAAYDEQRALAAELRAFIQQQDPAWGWWKPDFQPATPGWKPDEGSVVPTERPAATPLPPADASTPRSPRRAHLSLVADS